MTDFRTRREWEALQPMSLLAIWTPYGSVQLEDFRSLAERYRGLSQTMHDGALRELMTRWRPALGWNSDSLVPLMNLVEGMDGYEIRARLEGFEAADLQISVDRGWIMIRGISSRGAIGPSAAVCGAVVAGVETSQFERSLLLPHDADVDRIESAFGDEVLTIAIPKRIMSWQA